jgi:NAD(P)-dependent dehydrogenase (short-subunit alcohol dehydrogenase family)
METKGIEMTNISLMDKTALVTGASSGIGRATALSLARAGASVAVCYYTNETGARQTATDCGNNSIVLKGNVGDPADCRKILEMSIEKYGRLDIVVNNAAMAERDSLDMPYAELTAHWKKTFDTNLLSAVHISYWAIAEMRKRGSGKIINIASRSAFRGETEYHAYAASKAALVNFTRCLARTYATENILAYAVAPGFIHTEMAADDIKLHGDDIRSQIPSGRIGTPDDVASVVLFLASDLSNYMTGSTLDVNGGSYLH